MMVLLDDRRHRKVREDQWPTSTSRESSTDAFNGPVTRRGCDQVELVRTLRGHGEDMHMLPDGHFDAVVITYVLCTAIDGKKLISECKRVLRKMVQTHVWKSQVAVNTEEPTALVVVARALQQDVLEGFLRRTLRTRWTPVAGEAEESLRSATTVGAQS
ncbi:hypothetical protein MTO96_007614 [Rhipicephalus appendiculatus]